MKLPYKLLVVSTWLIHLKIAVILFGQFEGRKPSPATTTTAEINFDEQYYLTQNPDVKSLVEQGILSSGFEHYIEVGQFQQRQTAG